MSTNPESFAGKKALVTGASRGLGREIAFGLARAGADVALAGRDAEACEATAAEIEGATGRQAIGFGCHVGRWTEVDALAAAVFDSFGSVDVLVNNAGMSPTYDSVDEVTEELFDKVVAVNLRGPFRLSVLVGQKMAAGQGGAIVNVTSAAAAHPSPHAAPYAAAKAGLESLTQSLSHSFGPTVRVNSVMPGAFLTDVSRHWDMDAFAKESQRYALKRGGNPEEIVGAVLYLAGPDAGYTTGASLRVDGGWS